MAVDLHGVFGSDAFVDEEDFHILSVLALQLNNEAFLRVVNDGAVASEFLLKRLQ